MHRTRAHVERNTGMSGPATAREVAAVLSRLGDPTLVVAKEVERLAEIRGDASATPAPRPGLRAGAPRRQPGRLSASWHRPARPGNPADRGDTAGASAGNLTPQGAGPDAHDADTAIPVSGLEALGLVGRRQDDAGGPGTLDISGSGSNGPADADALAGLIAPRESAAASHSGLAPEVAGPGQLARPDTSAGPAAMAGHQRPTWPHAPAIRRKATPQQAQQDAKDLAESAPAETEREAPGAAAPSELLAAQPSPETGLPAIASDTRQGEDAAGDLIGDAGRDEESGASVVSAAAVPTAAGDAGRDEENRASVVSAAAVPTAVGDTVGELGVDQTAAKVGEVRDGPAAGVEFAGTGVVGDGGSGFAGAGVVDDGRSGFAGAGVVDAPDAGGGAAAGGVQDARDADGEVPADAVAAGETGEPTAVDLQVVDETAADVRATRLAGLRRIWAAVVGWFRDKTLESVATILLGVGGVIFPPIWLLGAMVALASRVWDGRDKLLGLAVPVLLTIVGTAAGVILAGSQSSLGHDVHVGWVSANIASRAAAALGATYLAWRSVRGRRPAAAPPWNKPYRVG
ncbi:MAG: hypothetical protein ACLQFR_32620 [Streptosporangiaceae bacterium]